MYSYARYIWYLRSGQISMSAKGHMWLHIILVSLTLAVLILLSLSINVIQKGMYSEPVYLKVNSDLALYLSGKSRSSS